MSEVELVKLSTRGQIVIPKDIRELLGLKGGERLAVKAERDVILLKKVEIPELEADWEDIFRWGERHAKKKGLKKKDVERIIHRARGVKD
ncbi:MAG: AbrB/MazE/SpoVT family DNA-binding domain-containing protein [Euryarchaeota archaeon]|nr:AbrB/MazE/SpoVT family DNA-binding domain-containing protein [Euryarchaeota archaeon]